MKKYITLKSNNNKKRNILEIISFLDGIFSDEILLDTDICYDEYNDDVIISAKQGYCEDLYIDDTLYYID